MRRDHRLSTAFASAALVCIGALTLASAASAQTAGEGRGLRYLSWTGRTEAAAPATPGPGPAAPPRRDLRRPNMVIPHGGFGAAGSAPGPGAPATSPAPRATLTPANAWLRPPAPPPEPMSVTAAPPPASPPASQPRSTPEYLPDQGGRGQSVPAAAVYATPSAPAIATADPADPMAPRRDAPIFRMLRDAPVPRPAAPRAEAAPPAPSPIDAPPRATRVVEAANNGDRPPQQGARYYSVHRQVGRRPDALEIPAPGYVEALAIGQIETLASQDLAAPERGPALIRDANGRVRAQPAAPDGDRQ